MKFIRSSLLMKILLLVLVVYATVTLVELQNNAMALDAQAAELQSQIDKINQENLSRQQDIENIDTEEGIRTLAGEQGLVEEDEIIFHVTGN